LDIAGLDINIGWWYEFSNNVEWRT